MALVSINQSQQTQRKPDAMDRVAQALQIAQSIVGTTVPLVELPGKMKTQNLQQAESKATIGEKTESAQPGEAGAFEVSGMGWRKPAPNLAKLIQSQSLLDKQKDAQAPSDDEYKAFIKVSPNSDLGTLKNLYPTRGDLRGAYDRILGATTVKVEDPFAAKKFEYEKGQDKEKKDLETQKRYVPQLGQYALTAEDADKTRDALATHESMKNSVDELIKLRRKYGGGQILNREDIARAQQISTKLLLKYKKLEGLGVLSKTDMELIDKLVPSNPLQINAAEVAGQDPTMAALQQLRSFTDDDMDIFLKNKGFHDLNPPKKPTSQDAENF